MSGGGDWSEAYRQGAMDAFATLRERHDRLATMCGGQNPDRVFHLRASDCAAAALADFARALHPSDTSAGRPPQTINDALVEQVRRVVAEIRFPNGVPDKKRHPRRIVAPGTARPFRIPGSRHQESPQ